MTPEELTKSLKAEAENLGFQLAGACPAIQPTGFGHFVDWLDAGFSGEMTYLPERKDAYRHPENVMDGVVGILMLGMNYQTVTSNQPATGQGRVSRYAWSEIDYHDIIHANLKTLVSFCSQFPGNIKARGVIDTAPLLEREFAQLSGLGWQAKNTMLINREIGSWFFLAAILLNVDLDYDQPFETSHCGTCTACIDACPTDAFTAPHVLDATRCISYLTIEHRSPIPLELRPQMGNWLFGCDICQDVCPWNNKAETTGSSHFLPNSSRNPMDLLELFYLDDNEFRKIFRKTPLWRSKRRGIVRNAAIALGNSPDNNNISALSRGLNDTEELIRGASAWALGCHSAEPVRPVLKARLLKETVQMVVDEIRSALERIS